MRRKALLQKAKGALTTRCAVADDHEKRRRQQNDRRIALAMQRYADRTALGRFRRHACYTDLV
jgi:hypothetical protein